MKVQENEHINLEHKVYVKIASIFCTTREEIGKRYNKCPQIVHTILHFTLLKFVQLPVTNYNSCNFEFFYINENGRR